MSLLSQLAECELCFSAANQCGFLCDACLSSLSKNDSIPFLFGPIYQVFCSFAYLPPISQWIIALKDHQQLNVLPKLLWLMQQNAPNLQDIDAVTYIPSDYKKILVRGFNPAELLARNLAHHYHLPVLSRAFNKTEGKDQRTLSRRQRLINSQQTLKPGKLNLEQQHILVIEDVITTGATAITAARALKQQGAAKVSVWALAHTQLK